jgi:predicted enzyme related to lactoylglutathione lyase
MTMIDERDNVAVWFEIPAMNFERAARFYETIFNARLRRQTIGGQKMGVFPYERPSVSGCVMEAPALAGQATGTIVYLNCNGHIDEVIERVERAGRRAAHVAGRSAGRHGRLLPYSRQRG